MKTAFKMDSVLKKTLPLSPSNLEAEVGGSYGLAQCS